MNVQLIPETFRNSMFEQNLEFLSDAYPDIFDLVKNHNAESHRLCQNPDGSANIVHLPSKTVLYPTSAEETDTLDTRRLQNMSRKVDFPKRYLLHEEDVFVANNSPVQTRAYSELLSITPMGVKQIEGPNEQKEFLVEARDPTYLPFVRVYGVGLGSHLLKLLNDKTIFGISIIEPSVDIFFASLFVTPWRILHQYFSVGSDRLSLVVGDTPENSIKKESLFIRQTFPFLTSNFGRLTMVDDDAVLGRMLTAEVAEDSYSQKSKSSGWYDDQKIGLYFSLCNIREQRLFYTGKKVSDFMRVFVIGSGPSLDESIEYIRRHCDKAVIFACGSALSPLMKAGIVPHFHVVQEREWERDMLGASQKNQLLKSVRLLKLNVVSPEIDSSYKETYVFQKFMDPGSSLLGAGFPATQGVNPTVTNAGVAFACELGADEVFLFGVDYGLAAGKDQWHSSNTIYDKSDARPGYNEEQSFEIKGNFGVPVSTTPILSWSLKVTETIIKRNKQAKFVNVGSGAYIDGADECRVKELPELTSLQGRSTDVVTEITACFSDEYIREERFQEFDEIHRPAIWAYVDSLRRFCDREVTSRGEIIQVLSTLYDAVDIGFDNPGFMPSSLLNGGIKRLIENVYLQSSLAASDAEAVNFFRRAMVVIDEYYTDVLRDLDNLFDSAVNAVEIVNWTRDA